MIQEPWTTRPAAGPRTATAPLPAGACTDASPGAHLTDDVCAAQRGDAGAFERLYRANSSRVYALCLRMTADPVRAAELTQDVFVRAWEKLASFEGKSAFSTWLHRLAVNQVLGSHRSAARHRARLVDDGAAELEVVPTRCAPAGMRLDLERAIATLPEGSRTVFVLHDVEGYTHDEIARMTGRSEGTSKSLLSRARRLLRVQLEA